MEPTNTIADTQGFVWDFNPEIFFLDFLPVTPRWYGLCFATGILLGLKIMKDVYMKNNRTEDELNSGFVIFVLGTILGARLGHCLFYEPAYYLSQPWKILMIWQGGLASHGGTIGIFLAMIYYTRKYKIPFIWLADRLAIAISLGVPFIRLGNFLNSEIYGVATNLPWAVVFKRVDNIPRHPTQIYEALSYFAMFIVQFVWYKRKGEDIPPGRPIGLMFIWIFGSRFFIEFFKVEQVNFEKGMSLNMGQILSIPMILLGVAFMMGAYDKLGLKWGAEGGQSSAGDKEKSQLTTPKNKDKKSKRKAERDAKKRNR